MSLRCCSFLFLIVHLALQVRHTTCCAGRVPVEGPDNPTPAPDPNPDPDPNPNPNPDGGPLENNLGINGDDTQDVDNGKYLDEGGGPVEDGAELECDFESSCCWTNAAPPQDDLEWRVTDQRPDPQSRFEQGTGTSTLPQGNYLVTAAAESFSYSEARFVSCSVACSDDPIVVSLYHWQTTNTQLQVCQQETFYDGAEPRPLLNCQSLNRGDSPGPSIVELPPGELIDIVIVASNFVGATGDAAIVDDILVAFTACAADNCPAVECAFEDGGACGYADSALGDGTIPTGATTPWEIVSGQYKNHVTGVQESPSGDSYAATYLFSDEVASFESGDLEMREERVLRFDHYEATYGIALRLCLDDVTNCIFNTDEEVQVVDRDWRTSSVMIPPDTQKVLFLAENAGQNQGAAAVDNLSWLKPDGSDPDDAFESAC